MEKAKFGARGGFHGAVATSRITIGTLAKANLGALVEIAHLNDAAISGLFHTDTKSWLDRGTPANGHYFTGLTGDRPVGMTGYKPDGWAQWMSIG